MKVIRLLVYEGSEEAMEKHLSQAFVRPGVVAGSHRDIEIREVFRGEQKDSEVVHFDEDDIPF